MGKSTDKLYITHSEWKNDFGGAKKKDKGDFRRLPFYCCSLGLTPVEHPVCSPQGHVFDLENIIPWISKHHTNPVTGEPLESKDLIKLDFFKKDGQYQCPITFKIFTESTHIVAIKTSGKVYCFDTIDKLNIKPKYWKDLLTDSSFTRRDIITIQDPHKIGSRNINDFHYVKEKLEVMDEITKQAKKSVESTINSQGSTGRILAEIASKKAEAPTPSFVKKEQRTKNQAHYSTGIAAASFTSMHFTPQTANIAATITDEEYLLKHVKGKGLVKIKTNLGEIDVELYCEEAPKTCFNFLQLSEKEYYNDVKFHRSIRDFMIQGGDPTGTGTGGTSHWGKAFEDEFHPRLRHSGRGILSMANKGKNTNTCQFFITYRAVPHLDNKHTVFGKVVGGMSTLDEFERMGTNKKDEPIEPIIIKSIEIFKNPFQDLTDSLDQETAKKVEIAEKRSEKLKRKAFLEEQSNKITLDTEKVGKYLKKPKSGFDNW